MTAETLLAALLRINLVASAAIPLVLLLRPWVLRWLGARVAYWLWLVVPIASAASFVPPRERIVTVASPAVVVAAQKPGDPVSTGPSESEETSAAVATTPFVSLPPLADVLVTVWLLGAGALVVRSIVSTRRLAADPSVGPALVGVLRPKLVLPGDFESRFDPQERALILAHEAVHRVSGHTVVNGLVEVARCASWFNPLVHLAAIRIRADQELACDAAVIAARPTERRAYAQALLKTQIAPVYLPLGCTWTSRSAKRMAERIEMVGRASLGRRGKIAGAAAVAIVAAGLGYAAWAQQPERVVTETAARPEAVWTPAVDAPVGTLSHALEGQRHDFFIELAQKGDIDVVFFGATTTEMWWWEQRGKTVWDREFGSLKAANFGSQGTHPDSLVWRMQNGELDGYQAKLVVLHAFGDADRPMPRRSRFRDWHAGYAAVIGEIRARQPEAKILIFAPFHREQTLREWREVAAANAAVFAGLVDDETVFYDDYGERFYRPDGSFKPDMWRSTEPALYEMWADELQPWLDRFVR
jgi:beta-lactamase regulating signal transducer with metallopeptidase domain